MAGHPEDSDITQILDGMPVGELERLEELGFCELGQGGSMASPMKRTT